MQQDAPPWIASHNKHIVIMTHSGKPIFSRYPVLDSGLAVCAMLRGLLAKTGDMLTSLTTPHFTLVALIKPHLIFLTISRTHESIPLLQAQLSLLYEQIVFHLTEPALNHLFQQNPNYDLASLLAGTHNETCGLIHHLHHHLHLGATPLAPLDSASRARLSKLLEHACRPHRCLFGVLLSSRAQVLAHFASRAPLPASDLLLLTNFVAHAPQVRQGAQTWTPLCLPAYNNSGHVQAYIAPVGLACTMVLLAADASLELFHALAQAHAQLRSALDGDGLGILLDAAPEPPSPHQWDCAPATFVAALLLNRLLVCTKHDPAPPLLKRVAKQRLLAIKHAHAALQQLPETRVLFDAASRPDLVVAASHVPPLTLIALFPPLTLQATTAAALSRARTHLLASDVFRD